MNPSLAKALLADREPGVQLLYGVATATNTVQVAGSTVAVELPALEPVVDGDYVAVLATGADRLILGRISESGFRVKHLQFVATGSPGVSTAQTYAHGISDSTIPGKIVSILVTAKGPSGEAIPCAVTVVDGVDVYFNGIGASWTHIHIVWTVDAVAFP